MAKQRIAVLGGGMGALSAVYALTNRPGWEENYEITVHQLGWRLGGKAATSRGKEGARIEEHGYHTLFGFYENTFAVMRDVYQTWGRDPKLPMSRLIAEDPLDERRHPERYGLHREDFFLMLQQLENGSWHTFPIEFPRNTDLPGDGSLLPSPLAYLEMAIELLIRLIEGQLIPHTVAASPTAPPSYWERVEGFGAHLLGELDPLSADAHGYRGHLDVILRLVRHLRDGESSDAVLGPEHEGLSLLVFLMRAFLEVLWLIVHPFLGTNWPAYLVWTSCDFVCTTLIGLIQDDVFRRGFDAIDGTNFWEWIASHATVPEGTRVTNSSMWVQAAYDSSFAYLRGDTTSPRSAQKPPLGNPSMGAGTMVRGGMRLMLTYKGAMAWKFWTGTAEVLVSPIFDILTKRGVKFEFFSKVTNLGADTIDGRMVISSVDVQRQVRLKDETKPYAPIVTIKDVPCWPPEPLWDQIADADAVRGYDLESHWTPWPGVENRTLRLGVDYDLVLLGIPVGMLDVITPELKAKSQSWNAMTTQVLTVRTEAIQTWMTRDLAGLGWTGQDAPVNVGVQPLDTWADMSQQLVRETWPEGAGPASSQYFCSAMRDDPDQPAPPSRTYAATQTQWVFEDGVRFFESQSTQFWPKARTETGAFDWTTMFTGDRKVSTPAALEAQYVRANIDPNERYVLSVPGSFAFRLEAHGSDFVNLYLAGDWTRNGLNVGCMEATVTSGLLASKAIAGYPTNIVGLEDFGPPRPRGAKGA